MSQISRLAHESTRLVLENIWSEAAQSDPQIIAKARTEGEKLGHFTDRAVSHLLQNAFLAVDEPTAKLLYGLVRARRPQLVVEFGTSFGVSALHIGAALLDAGAGRLITTELEPEKVRRARQNLDAAGVGEVIEIRQGDALETLAADREPIDFLFLDGWKDLYLPVLQLLEPRLAQGAVIVADDLDILPDALRGYLAYVREPRNGYHTVEIPIGDKLELSIRL